MKKTIIAIATIAILSVGNSFAQRGFPSKGHNVPAVVYQTDNAYEEYNINKLDHIVGLSRKQQNEIKKIENRYDRIAASNRRSQTLQGIKQLEVQKQREILSVLSPVQRKQLVAYQQSQRFDNRGRYNRKG